MTAVATSGTPPGSARTTVHPLGGRPATAADVCSTAETSAELPNAPASEGAGGAPPVRWITTTVVAATHSSTTRTATTYTRAGAARWGWVTGGSR